MNASFACFYERLSGGVTVAQGPLEAFDMVRIHAGQPIGICDFGLTIRTEFPAGGVR